MTEDAGLVWSVKLAPIFHLDMSSSRSQGKQAWVEKGGAVDLPGSSQEGQRQAEDLLRGPRDRLAHRLQWEQLPPSLAPPPPSPWPESQKTPGRKWEWSETRPMLSCIGSKTWNQARCWQKHSRAAWRLFCGRWRVRETNLITISAFLSTLSYIQFTEIRADIIFSSRPN